MTSCAHGKRSSAVAGATSASAVVVKAFVSIMLIPEQAAVEVAKTYLQNAQSLIPTPDMTRKSPGSGMVTPSGYAVFPRQNSVLVEIVLSNSWSWYVLESGALYRGSWRHG
jgi:hypothetical protein